ncbi:MAG: isopentenyl-diphosphate delta-isomerase [Bacteroidota bacterium]
MDSAASRKKDHIELAFKAQTGKNMRDDRFHYEPLLHAHPAKGLQAFSFLGKTMKAPLWVSSMTGGTKMAGIINRNLARACNEFGLGMGLGSCRALLDDDTHFADFDMRPLIGEDQPLWANLGIAQIEKMLIEGSTDKAIRLLDRLRADGLIIHVNPMQEWFQPEGDILAYPPIDTITRFMEGFPYPLIVKEVGQGMGPGSLRRLLDLPLAAIEFAAFGGTNFATVEILRSGEEKKSLFEPLSFVGEDAAGMLETVNRLVSEREPQCKSLIISGGVKNFLDGYYYISKSVLPAVYGMASAFLENARNDYEQLRLFTEGQIKGLEMAHTYLTVK